MFNSNSLLSLSDSSDVNANLQRIRENCKGSVRHAAEKTVQRFEAEKGKLEKKLNNLLRAFSFGVLSWIKKRSEILKIKKKIAEINTLIETWVNAVYSYFIV